MSCKMAKAIAVVVLYAMSVHSVPSVHETFCKIFINNAAMIRAVARALIGGGVSVHIFVLCPTNFF